MSETSYSKLGVCCLRAFSLSLSIVVPDQEQAVCTTMPKLTRLQVYTKKFHAPALPNSVDRDVPMVVDPDARSWVKAEGFFSVFDLDCVRARPSK